MGLAPVVLAAALAVAALPTTSSLEMRVEVAAGQPDLITVALVGVPASVSWTGADAAAAETWERVLRVSVADPGSLTPSPPLFGRYVLEQGTLRFRPRFPISPGLVVSAFLDGAAFDAVASTVGTPDLHTSYTVPELGRLPSARITEISPSVGAGWPENLLRFYLYFSDPMSPIDLAERLELVDLDSGKLVAEPFVVVAGGLWDQGRQRATVLVHPGRVKRDVGPRVALGPVFETGRRYRLSLAAAAVLDTDGVTMAAPWAVDFEIGPADTTGPDPERWSIRPPQRPDGVLELNLDAPADRALLARLVAVEDADGLAISGDVEVGPDGRLWRLHPASAWRSGEYTLVVAPELEDSCGNQIGRRFEEPLVDSAGAAERLPLRLRFEVVLLE